MKKALQRQNRCLQGQWQRHFLRHRQDENRSFWIICGFGIGLTLASAITYWLIRRNLGYGSGEEEETTIELTLNGTKAESLNGALSHVSTKNTG